MDSTCGPDNSNYYNSSNYGAHGYTNSIVSPLPVITVPEMLAGNYQPHPSPNSDIDFSKLYHNQSAYNGGRTLLPSDKTCANSPNSYNGVTSYGVKTCNCCCNSDLGSCGSCGYQSRENYGLYGHSSGPNTAPSTRENFTCPKGIGGLGVACHPKNKEGPDKGNCSEYDCPGAPGIGYNTVCNKNPKELTLGGCCGCKK